MNFKNLIVQSFLCLFCCSAIVQAQCPNSYTINNTKPSCLTSSNGSISLSQTTYYSSASYSWSNGATTRNLYNLSPGHYTVTVTDPTTCTYTATSYLAPSPTGLQLNPTFQQCNARLSVNVSWPYDWPLSYQWSDGSTTNFLMQPAPGIYAVTATDASGCSGTANTTVLPYSLLNISNTSTAATCNNANGSIDLTVSGGQPPYTFYWYDAAAGQTSEDVSNVPAGNTRVYVRDANFCSQVYTANVSGPFLDFSATLASCGLNNASASVQAIGLTNPSYQWSNGATTSSITGLAVGFYALTASDGSCVLTDSIQIYNAGNLNVYINDSSSTDGCTVDQIYANAYGGAGNDYQYLWSTGATTQTIHVQAGVSNYTLTVTDANGCTVSDNHTVNNANSISFSSVVQDATCGNADGAIDMTLNTPVSAYLWSPTGATTEDVSGLYAGFHVLRVEYFGCYYYDTIAVGEFVESSLTDASCGLSNGSASVQDYGMTSPSFLWNTGATSNALNNLAAGTYYVSVTNGSCVVVDTVEILDAGQMTAAIQFSSTCQPDEMIAVPYAGAAPYTYLWSNASTAAIIQFPTPGSNHAVTITDANGCSNSASIQVPNPPLFTATYSVTDASCNAKNGAIFLNVNGGTLPMQYSWSLGGGNVKDLYNVWPGQYSVNITDNNGCQFELSNMVVGGQNNISVSHSITQVNASNTGGAIDITVSGVSSASYQWSNGATTEDINNLSSGYYSVSITDNTTNCVFARHYSIQPAYTGNPNIRINGYVRDVSATGNCINGLHLPNEMVRLQPLGIIDFTNANGYYEFNITTPGNYTVEYINTSPLTTTVLCPVGNIATISNAVQGGVYVNNFFLTNPPVQDLKIELWDYSPASPGFPYHNRIRFCNKGNTIMNGTVEYDYNSMLGFQSITGGGSTLTLHDIPNHLFNWSFSSLMPGECRAMDVKFTVPTSAALGTVLTGTASVLPSIGDATPADNVSIEQTTIVGSWDPNDKQVAPYHSGDSWTGGVIYENEEELEYLIRFQNTGTAPAQFVIIRDTLDAHLIPESIHSISTKHAVDVRLESGNILIFTFDNIYLPDSSTDFDASIGFARFKINRTPGLPVGTQIPNTAAIYFDYNAPVITNTPISVIDINTALLDIDNKAVEATAMPNPFTSQISLKYTLQESTTVRVQVLNSMGQQVLMPALNASKAEGLHIDVLDMRHLPQGIYFIQLSTAHGSTTKKVLKSD